VGASIGIALSPTDATNPSELLELADQAMYRAKRGGKNRFVFVETTRTCAQGLESLPGNG